MSDGTPSRSPWVAQVASDGVARVLDTDVEVDVAIIGGGIAGAATAFFTLRDTDHSVLLIERDRMGHGATGHNAGQLTTYFERPLLDIVDEYGFELAIDAQRAIDETWTLLDEIVAATGTRMRIDRFVGHLAMYTLNHLCVHLAHCALRARGGLRVPECWVSEDCPFLDEIPPELADLCTVVPAAQIRTWLGTADDRYCAALADYKGCANGALLVHEIIAYLRDHYPDRFRAVDHTAVDRVVLDDDRARITAGSRHVSARQVVMCTNGFMDHVIESSDGAEIGPQLHHRVSGTVGYMAAFLDQETLPTAALSFIRNLNIGESTPYVYTTRRQYEHAGRTNTLTCIGGPEMPLADIEDYSADSLVPDHIVAEVDDLLAIAEPRRQAGLPYDFVWHGLMGYTPSRVRLIGFEPRNPVMLYNLGCNGVGFLPSIYGGLRVARLLRGDDLGRSIFDPPPG